MSEAAFRAYRTAKKAHVRFPKPHKRVSLQLHGIRCRTETDSSMTIKMAIMGFGTIGSGVFDVVNTNASILAQRVGDDVVVSHVLDIRDFPGQPVENVLVKDVNAILDDPQVGIVVETMGGVEPAFSFVKGALEAGKSVVTSNKELVAAKGTELFACAAQHNASFLFGASVGGGIPIIRPLLSCLTADRIERISGILNGTTNYILTKMNREGIGFDDALKQAQALGYAEADYDRCVYKDPHLFPYQEKSVTVANFSYDGVSDRVLIRDAWDGSALCFDGAEIFR